MDGCCHNLYYSFATLLGAITIYYVLGWNALKQELDKGRKKPVGPTLNS